MFVSDSEARRRIIDIGQMMYDRGFVAANDGNISVRTGENEFWMTPTLVSKGGLREDMLVKMTLFGERLEGTLKPSSEVKLHMRVYMLNNVVGSVVHAHPPYATAFAIANMPIMSRSYPEFMVNIGDVPVAAYSAPGSEGVARSIEPFVNTHNAVLLANHGAVTWADTAEMAWFRMESLEHYAKIMAIGASLPVPPRELTHEEQREVVSIRNGLGIKAGLDIE